MENIVKVRVVPKAKKNLIKQETDTPTGTGTLTGTSRLKVYLTSSAIGGKANKALIEALSKHFNVKKSQISIIKGEKTRDKFVKID